MKKRCILTISTTLIIVAAAISAFADQAAWVSREEAARALAILANSRSVKHYCEPCSDKSVRTEAVESIGLFRVDGENYWEVQINGKGVDLAYLYFEKKPGKWQNAAMTAKIKVEGVPKKLSDALASLGN